MSALRTNRLTRRTPLRRVSAARRIALRLYMTLCRRLLRTRPVCEVPGCGVRRGLQLHHVVKRSHAPRRLLDETNLAVLCPPHHAQTDAPFARGRLVIAAGEEGRVFAVVTKPNKWT